MRARRRYAGSAQGTNGPPEGPADKGQIMHGVQVVNGNVPLIAAANRPEEMSCCDQPRTGALIGRSLPRRVVWEGEAHGDARAMRFATVAVLAIAAVGLPHTASADSARPAYNVTQPIGVAKVSAIALDPASHLV